VENIENIEKEKLIEAHIALQKDYSQLQKGYANLKAENLYLQQEMSKIKRMLFGAKSERFVSSKETGMESLFDFPEEKEEETQEENITYTRKKNKPLKQKQAVRQSLPENLPRETTLIEPTEDTSEMKKIGESVTEILEYKPGVMYVKRYVRPKYAKADGEGVVIGELPSLPIPKGNAGPGLLSHLLVSKYVDHLPFHRQKKQFKRLGIELAESTINDWFKKTCTLLEPLYDRLCKEIISSDYIMADETTMPVQTSEKSGATHTGYQWVYHSPIKKLVCLSYAKGRARTVPKDFLKDFKGTIQTDGYAVYNYLEKEEQITLLTCLAHARRKFEQALSEAPVKVRHVLSEIQKLYAIERKAKDEEMSFEERKSIRIQKAKPILDDLNHFLIKERSKVYLPKSDMAKALNYTLKLWHRIIRYIEDGRYEIDNNPVERSIRPIALGRKNYMFAGSHEAAQNAAMIYSFFGSCNMNKINPYNWLKDVLERISDYPANKLHELLPNRIKE
jgi:transposase